MAHPAHPGAGPAAAFAHAALDHQRRVDPEPFVDAARVWCGLTIAEIRTGGQRQIGLNEQRFFAARCEYRLRPAAPEAGWRILLKKVTLLNADQPLYNLTFVV